MKTKAQKQEAIEQLEKSLPEASITIFTTFSRAGEQGLTVSQLQQLKRSLRKEDAEYVVAKKTLLTKALKDLNYDGIDVDALEGSVGLVVGRGDIYAVARAAYQFAKANPALRLFVAYSDGKVMTTEEVTEVATMPSKDELIARLLGMLNYPLRSLAIVLNQIAEKAPSGGESPAQETSEAPATEAATETTETAEAVPTPNA